MAPNGQRDEAVEQSVGAQRELDRAASNVHHDPAADAEIEVRERAAEGEPRFVLATQRADSQPGLGAHAIEKRAAVGGFAHGARGDGLDALGTELLGERRHAGQRLERRLASTRRSAAPVWTMPGAEPRLCLQLIDDADRAVGGDVGDDLSNRVRSDIDCGDPNCPAVVASAESPATAHSRSGARADAAIRLVSYRSRARDRPGGSPPWTPGAASRGIVEVVLDLLAFGEEHRVLADVGRQVGDALEVAAHQDELEGRA